MYDAIYLSMSTSEHYWIIFLAYVIFSFYGLKCVRDYTMRCLQAGHIPFNGSVWRVVLYSIVCGLFTTLILLYTVLESFWDAFQDFWDKMRKK